MLFLFAMKQLCEKRQQVFSTSGFQKDAPNDDEDEVVDEWVMCDTCDNWYHQSCAHTKWQDKDIAADEWHCCV